MSLRTFIRHQLKRWPILYRVAEVVYSIRLSVFGSRIIERKWTKRHLQKGNDWNNRSHIGQEDEWILGYWDSRNHSHRQILIDKIASYYPFSSILEIGCNCGPNLYLLANRFPDIQITGIDINERAIEKGRELFTSESILNVKLMVGKADKLEHFSDKSVDIIFTDAALMYVSPSKISNVIQEMLRIARRALILIEQQSIESSETSHRVRTRYSDRWLRDYVALFQQFVPKTNINITKITEDIWPDQIWKEAGAVIEVDK